jgi:hypothetical protein
MDGRVSILRGAVLPSADGTNSGEEHEMDKITDLGEPASELERLIADLSGSLEAGGCRSGSLALLYSSAVLVSDDLVARSTRRFCYLQPHVVRTVRHGSTRTP